jgi:hypothetical protein
VDLATVFYFIDRSKLMAEPSSNFPVVERKEFLLDYGIPYVWSKDQRSRRKSAVVRLGSPGRKLLL